VVVTGGAKGAGLATVKRFVAGGCDGGHSRPQAHKRDSWRFRYLRRPERSRRRDAPAEAALERMGAVDILVHVAGGSSSPAGGLAALSDDTGVPSSASTSCRL